MVSRKAVSTRQLPDRKAAYGRKGRGVVAVDYEPRHLVFLVGYERLLEELPERRLGEDHLGRYALFVAGGGASGGDVAAAARRGLAHDLPERGERPVARADLESLRLHGRV